ncbi:MAG: rimI [Jatrophihabitantaceae bacterium]|nr:rimI [Jatrophihabitantaceae bacterium]
MIVLERMRPAHIPLVLEHEHALFGTESWSAGMYRDELADPWNRHYVVAFDDPDAFAGASADEGPVAAESPIAVAPPDAKTAHRRFVGWAGLMVIGDTAEILTIGTVPLAQRRGIATVLMDALLVEARRRRAREVLLEVRVDNEPAKAMYARYGFEQMGVRRGYYQPANVDAATLRLAL